MIAVDTSVVVPMFATWHEAHDASVGVLAAQPRLPAHSAAEAFAVLTRLPAPHRAPAEIVAEFLDRLFPTEARLLPAEHQIVDLPRLCVGAGVSGGAIYDALIALTARHHDAALVTRDRRAMRTYRAFGAEVTLLG